MRVPVRRADPDRACPHEDFAANVEVSRLTDPCPCGHEHIGTCLAGNGRSVPPIFCGCEIVMPVKGYSADVTIRCAQCDEPFRFIGMPAGLLPDRPACDPAETEARLPIRPASSDPDFGLGIPGFAVRYRETST